MDRGPVDPRRRPADGPAPSPSRKDRDGAGAPPAGKADGDRPEKPSARPPRSPATPTPPRAGPTRSAGAQRPVPVAAPSAPQEATRRAGAGRQDPTNDEDARARAARRVRPEPGEGSPADREPHDREGGGGRAARRPRRLATSETAAPDDAPEAPASPPRETRIERRRELTRTLRGRRSALPSTPADDGEASPAAPAADPPAARRRVEPAAPAADPPPRERGDAISAPLPDPPAERRRPRSVVDAPDRDVVVEVMTFLCAVILGSAIIIDRAADAWSASVLDDVSVTVLPLDGDPVARRLEAAAQIMRATPGLAEVTVVPTSQSEALLEPWLGTGTDLSLLPVPRLVTARRTGDLDAVRLREELGTIPGVSLDDHTAWSERLSRMAAAVTGGAVAALALMLLATAISIVFATRSTIASNAETVEVLHVLGADDGFIQRAFRGRFLRVGIRGAAFGLAGALALFGVLEAWAMMSAGAASQQSAALLGAPSIGPAGFAGLVAVALLVAALVALTARLAVRRHLRALER